MPPRRGVSRNNGITFVEAGGDMGAVVPAAAAEGAVAAEVDDEEPAGEDWGRDSQFAFCENKPLILI